MSKISKITISQTPLNHQHGDHSALYFTSLMPATPPRKGSPRPEIIVSVFHNKYRFFVDDIVCGTHPSLLLFAANS
jgi:hypothetical protein